jgi:alkaline phosphatase D
LSGVAKVAAGAATAQLLGGCSAADRYPFSLGIAAGDPLPDGIVLWTRVAPDPLGTAPASARSFPVRWQVSADEGFSRVVRHGVASAHPRSAHCVHVDVRGLEPGRWYWYRFRVGRHVSPVGRARTAPARDHLPSAVSFATASCQNYQHGYYGAYEDMTKQDLDFVVHLGDYIYETEPHAVGPRLHVGEEAITLADYRRRHALYKTDPDLQAAHAAFPFIVVPDDHEVEDNYAGRIPQEGSDTPDAAGFALRRRNAYQAYWEHQPVRLRTVHEAVYRRFDFGRLVSFHMLDTRRYRSDQPCGDGVKPPCPPVFDERATMTGRTQERWLYQSLAARSARWNVLGQQTLFAPVVLDDGGIHAYAMDQWDGYVAARHRVLRFLEAARVRRPIIISGDTHAGWVNEVSDGRDQAGAIAVEFGCPSITSVCPPSYVARVTGSLARNPHVKYFNGTSHGYVKCTVTSGAWKSDYRIVETTQRRHARARTAAAFVLESGIDRRAPEIERRV